MASGPMEYRELTPVKSKAAKHVNKEWKTGDSYPPPQLKPLPPSLQTISLIWHQLFPKKLQILNCKVFRMRKCNKILAIHSILPLITPDAASFKKNKTKTLLQSSPAYFTKTGSERREPRRERQPLGRTLRTTAGKKIKHQPQPPATRKDVASDCDCCEENEKGLLFQRQPRAPAIATSEKCTIARSFPRTEQNLKRKDQRRRAGASLSSPHTRAASITTPSRTTKSFTTPKESERNVFLRRRAESGRGEERSGCWAAPAVWPRKKGAAAFFVVSREVFT
ncbi:uncharacterized protein LOC144323932 [Canis aureus]